MRISTISKTPHDFLNRKDCVETISKQNRTITKKDERNLSTTSTGTSRGMKGC